MNTTGTEGKALEAISLMTRANYAVLTVDPRSLLRSSSEQVAIQLGPTDEDVILALCDPSTISKEETLALDRFVRFAVMLGYEVKVFTAGRRKGKPLFLDLALTSNNLSVVPIGGPREFGYHLFVHFPELGAAGLLPEGGCPTITWAGTGPDRHAIAARVSRAIHHAKGNMESLEIEALGPVARVSLKALFPKGTSRQTLEGVVKQIEGIVGTVDPIIEAHTMEELRRFKAPAKRRLLYARWYRTPMRGGIAAQIATPITERGGGMLTLSITAAHSVNQTTQNCEFMIDVTALEPWEVDELEAHLRSLQLGREPVISRLGGKDWRDNPIVSD